MNNMNFSSIDYLPLSPSDRDLIINLTRSNADPADRAALEAALSMLLKQRNLLGYRVGELLDKSTALQSELLRKATTLQTLLDHANASVALQYSACLANDEIRRQFTATGSTVRELT